MRKSFVSLLIFFLTSCEKTINIEPEIGEPVLVVDAQIESGKAPVVVLTNSINYFSSISKEILSQIFVRNANVTINDGNRNYTLKEYSVPIGGGNKAYYYTTDSLNPTSAIVGSFGKKYNLQVEVNGKSYSAQTTIPLLTKKIDSLWWRTVPVNSQPTKVILMAKVTDPPGYGNYIRYFTKVNNGIYLAGASSVANDQVVDGKTYELQIEQGIDRNNPPDPDAYGFFERGDTITVKLCNTDKATYDFWRTVEFGYQSVGNPFSSPIKVLGNITNGGLGVFCGYAAQFKTLAIPK